MRIHTGGVVHSVSDHTLHYHNCDMFYTLGVRHYVLRVLSPCDVFQRTSDEISHPWQKCHPKCEGYRHCSWTHRTKSYPRKISHPQRETMWPMQLGKTPSCVITPKENITPPVWNDLIHLTMRDPCIEKLLTILIIEKKTFFNFNFDKFMFIHWINYYYNYNIFL